jgi:hypothetical protein
MGLSYPTGAATVALTVVGACKNSILANLDG